MQAEFFSKLKEYDSLTKIRFGHLRQLKEQEDRLSKIKTRLIDENLQTEKLKHEHSLLRQNLLDTEEKLKLLQEQRQRLIDLGGDDKKINDYTSQIDTIENQGLSLLETIDTNENELKEKKEFISGLTKTLKEIESEVLEEKDKEQKEIKNLDLRIKSLENELPSEFQSTLQKVVGKNLAHGPFTRIEAGSCYFCRFKLSRIEESEVDAQRQLKLCSQCGRIFLPYGI